MVNFYFKKLTWKVTWKQEQRCISKSDIVVKDTRNFLEIISSLLVHLFYLKLAYLELFL